MCELIAVNKRDILPVAYPGIFFGGVGVSANSVEDRMQREGDLGAVAPYSGVLLNLEMSETLILIRLLLVYFPWNWKFSSAFSKLQISLKIFSTTSTSTIYSEIHRLRAMRPLQKIIFILL
jgi:hypothetical protein